MMNFVVFILLCLVSIIGSIGNIFIIGAVCLSKRLRVKGNVFVINLAVADLIITAYIMPIGLATSQYKGDIESFGTENQTDFSLAVNPFGDVLCDINAFLILTTCGVSTQSLMMIAIERYCHICKIHWYKRFFTRTAVIVMVIFTWIYTIIWTSQGWTGWTLYLYGEDIYVCLFSGPYSLSYDICLAFFGMVLPMIVISFCYFNIFRTVRTSKNNIRDQKKKVDNNPNDPALMIVYQQRKKKLRKEQRLIWTLFTIVVLFIIFWLPASIVLPLSGFWADMPKILYAISVWCAFCNSGVNSIVYGAMNKNFRDGYIGLFKQIFFCFFMKKKCKCCSGTHDESLSTSQFKASSPDTSTSNEMPKKSIDSNGTTMTSETIVSHRGVTSYGSQNKNGGQEITSPKMVEVEMSPPSQEKVVLVDTSDTMNILRGEQEGYEVVFVTKM